MALSIESNRKVVTKAGTAEALEDAARGVEYVIIQSETDNTGLIAVGDSNVVAATGSQKGTMLNVGDSMTLLLVDLNDIYIDSAIDGDGVTYLFVG